MLKFLLAVHVVLAVFAIGPLVHAATTAVRGVRRGDAGAVATSARTLRIYAYASVLVIIAGFGLMSQKWHGQKVGEFGQTWIWLSLVLWLVAVAIVLAVLVPTLDKAAKDKAAKGDGGGAAVKARVAASGGVVGVLFLVIVVLMSYQPGR